MAQLCPSNALPSAHLGLVISITSAIFTGGMAATRAATARRAASAVTPHRRRTPAGAICPLLAGAISTGGLALARKVEPMECLAIKMANWVATIVAAELTSVLTKVGAWRTGATHPPQTELN